MRCRKLIAGCHHEWTRIHANESQTSSPICPQIGSRSSGHNEGIRPADRSDYVHAAAVRWDKNYQSPTTSPASFVSKLFRIAGDVEVFMNRTDPSANAT